LPTRNRNLTVPHQKLDLHEQANPGCKKCDRHVRKQTTYAGFMGGQELFDDPEVVKMAELGQDDKFRAKFRECYRDAMRSLR
jgi:hypothetical protein